MAYPWAEAPRARDFVTLATKSFGCELARIEGIVGPRGPVIIEYLRRKLDGQMLLSEPLPTDLDDRLAPDAMRRLCVQLRLNSKDFGYDVEWMPLDALKN